MINPAAPTAPVGVQPPVEVANLQNPAAPENVRDNKLPAKMNHAYPTEAVKRVHEKPTPAVQPPFVNRGGSSGGQQRFMPQKQNH